MRLKTVGLFLSLGLATTTMLGACSSTSEDKGGTTPAKQPTETPEEGGEGGEGGEGT